MTFPLLTLITSFDEAKSPARRLPEVVDSAVLGEEPGFDGFAVGEQVAPVLRQWKGR
ncbi:hypothetical protein [Actinoplanes sp. NPDC020271]|uniref:hypothetical protein n=1 Tax=Actinoplanes sp. NPDC020271 TaxID=3363896 RepID=UPI00379B9F89